MIKRFGKIIKKITPTRIFSKSPEKDVAVVEKNHNNIKSPEEKKHPHGKKGEHQGNEKNKNRNPNRNRRNRNKNKKQNGSNQQKNDFKPKVIPPLPEIKEVENKEGSVKFTELDMPVELKAAAQDLEFKYCTPVQALSLPGALAGKDLTGKAQTGTGKTAAFLIAALNHILNNPVEHRRNGACRVLVLAPTRELAIQIHKDAEALSKYCNLNNLVVFGGMAHQEQRNSLKGPVDILVGTPGRIIDYERSGDLKLQDAEILVIDEADRMLDMGFIPDVRRIVSRLPKPGKRQTMFFSATLTNDILSLVDRWLVDPVEIEIEPENVVTDLIKQRFYSVLSDDKFPLLIWLINNENINRMLIFGNRKDRNIKIVKGLAKFGIRCTLLSGDVPQNKRLKILEDFRSGRSKVLIATDVAARGIHVDGISHVVNYDLPEKADDYVHRIGRTGRAGEKGLAISFVCEYGAYSVPEIEELVGRQIPSIQPEPEALKLPRAKHSGGGRKNHSRR